MAMIPTGGYPEEDDIDAELDKDIKEEDLGSPIFTQNGHQRHQESLLISSKVTDAWRPLSGERITNHSRITQTTEQKLRNQVKDLEKKLEDSKKEVKRLTEKANKESRPSAEYSQKDITNFMNMSQNPTKRERADFSQKSNEPFPSHGSFYSPARVQKVPGHRVPHSQIPPQPQFTSGSQEHASQSPQTPPVPPAPKVVQMAPEPEEVAVVRTPSPQKARRSPQKSPHKLARSPAKSNGKLVAKLLQEPMPTDASASCMQVLLQLSLVPSLIEEKKMEADFKMSELEKVAIPPAKITMELFNIIRMHSDRPDAKETALALVPVFSSYLAIFLALNHHTNLEAVLRLVYSLLIMSEHARHMVLSEPPASLARGSKANSHQDFPESPQTHDQYFRRTEPPAKKLKRDREDGGSFSGSRDMLLPKIIAVLGLCKTQRGDLKSQGHIVMALQIIEVLAESCQAEVAERKLLYGYVNLNLLEPILRPHFNPALLCAAVNVLIWLVKDPSFNTTFISDKESESAGNNEKNVADLVADLIQPNYFSSTSSSDALRLCVIRFFSVFFSLMPPDQLDIAVSPLILGRLVCITKEEHTAIRTLDHITSGDTGFLIVQEGARLLHFLAHNHMASKLGEAKNMYIALAGRLSKQGSNSPFRHLEDIGKELLVFLKDAESDSSQSSV